MTKEEYIEERKKLYEQAKKTGCLVLAYDILLSMDPKKPQKPK
ncbi:hypothetical protein LCGC14_0390410 [marine sediment metagenome]|uniref:Uncharacterized protein n=1 Tax=marine sediment metagenome TaxID=412755 RepID=A0A0F9VLR3_9ZZZZ